MNRRTRLKDIALELGVSANTVSLALKGSTRINEQTRMKVLQKAKELKYVPNTLARSLVQKKSNTIGLILPQLTNPIFAETAQRIEHVLVENGYHMILMTTDRNPKNELSAIDILLSREVDGIFLYPIKSVNREKISAIREANYPVVLLSNGQYDPPSDAVYMNQYLGGYKAAMHLLNMGHREIALISGRNDGEKHKGFRAALEQKGLEYDQELIVPVDRFVFEQGYKAAAELFQKRRPTAILATGDYLALGAMRWCRQNGLRIPEDVAIVGYDNLEAGLYAEVPLTTVSYNFEEITDQATRLLFSLIDEERDVSQIKPKNISIEPNLVIRSSCGFQQA